MSGVASTINDNGKVYLLDRNCLSKNFIESGLKMTSSGLAVNITPGTCDIDGKYHELTTQASLVLPQRMACMPYALKSEPADAPTFGYVQAAFPAADTGTVCRWIVDGSANIASTVGNNTLTKTGTLSQVDGWIGYAGQGDGSTGYYTSANSTGFPLGAAVRETDILFTFNGPTGSQQCLVAWGVDSTNSGNTLQINTDNSLYYGDYDDTLVSGFALETGKAYFVCVQYDGSMAYMYINGSLVGKAAYSTNNQAGVMSLFRTGAGARYSNVTIHYIELRNALRTPAQIAAISNALLLPCRYTPNVNDVHAFIDIRSILPTDSIALGYVRTDATHTIECDDTSYKYGRREGAVGGNRRVFLGWKYASSNAALYWDNPFDTRKIKSSLVWAQDSNGTNESEMTQSKTSTGVEYGYAPMNTSAHRLQFAVSGNGYAFFNGAWQTSGYIGCYAEVIE